MHINLTISQKLIGFALMVVVMLIGMGATGYWGVRHLNDAMQATVHNSVVLQNHLTGDTMRDALRADVYVALATGPTANASEKQAVRDELAEHAKTYREQLAKNDALPVDPETKTALAEIRTLLDVYIQSAGQMVDKALENTATAKQGLAGFATHSHALEIKMAQLSARLENTNNDGLSSAAATVEKAHRIIFLVGGLATVVTALLAWLIAAYIITSIKQLCAVASKAARGDLTVRSVNTLNDEMGQLGTALNTMLGDFQSAVGEITSSATQLAAAAEEVSAVTEQSTQGVKQQQGEIDQVATAMNEMTATVQEVANNAEQAANAARAADQNAKSGALVASEAMGGIDALVSEVEKSATVIHELETESDSIGTVLDVIKGIAEQTNLLALNAAIEAARAGEQGRGFAVVADEVRTLASRTQKSTQEIHTMIERLQSGARNAVRVMEQARAQGKKGVEQVERTAESLAQIAGAVATINDMNTQIASAAEEQSAVAEEINRNVVNISQGSLQSAQGSEQTALASQELARLASNMQTLVARFKV